jgi:hypothetical protein
LIFNGKVKISGVFKATGSRDQFYTIAEHEDAFKGFFFVSKNKTRLDYRKRNFEIMEI